MSLFLKNSFLGAVSVGTRLTGSFILNKVVAVYFGPAGVAQLSHFQNLLLFFTSVPNDGINRGLIKYLAGKQPDSVCFIHYLKAAFYLTLIAFAVSVIVVIAANQYFLKFFPQNFSWLVYFFTGALLLVLQTFFNAVLLARQQNILLVAGNVVGAGLVIIYLFWAKDLFSLPFYLVGYLLTMGSIMMYALPVSMRGVPINILVHTTFSTKAAKQISKFIIMSLGVLVFSKGLEYYIRSFLFQHYSIYQTGLWQGVVRVSDSYTAVYAAVLAFAFYPKAASLIHDKPALKFFVGEVFKIIIPIVALGLSLVYVLQEQIFTLLLSSTFTKAKGFIPYQLSGDFFKLTSWILANLLVAQANFRMVLLLEGVSAVAYLGYFYFFTSQFGIVGTSMAHCANYFTFLLLNVVYFRKLLF